MDALIKDWGLLYLKLFFPSLETYIFFYIMGYTFVSYVCFSISDWYVCPLYRKEGQDTQDELQKRNLREELEDRERRHFSSKDKTYSGKNMSPTLIS